MPMVEAGSETGTPDGVRLRRVRPRGLDWRRRDLGRLLILARGRFEPVERLSESAGRLAPSTPDDGGREIFMSYPRFNKTRLSWRSWNAFAMRDLHRERIGYLGAATLSAVALAAPAVILARSNLGDLRQTLLVICALFVFATTVAMLAGWQRQWRDRLDECGELAVQSVFWDRIVAAPSAALMAIGAVLTAQAAATAMTEAERARRAGTTLLAALPLIGIPLLAAALAEPLLAGLIAVAATLHAVVQGVIGLAVAAERGAGASDIARAHEAALAMARAFPEARLDGSQRWHLARVEEALACERRHGLAMAGWATAREVASVALQLGALVALVVVWKGQAGLGILLAQLYLAVLIIPTAGRLGAAFVETIVSGGLADATRILRALSGEARHVGTPCPAIERITLVQASLIYPGSDRPALAPIDFSIARGEVVALTGASGAGKSTLLRLLMGLDRPDTGAVRVNDLDLCDLDLATFQARITAVSQDEICPVATIRAIVMGQAQISPQQATDAIAIARMGEVVEALPMGLQTLVSSASFPSVLIGKLFVARALARQPEILFLDEALYAFTQSEQSELLNDLRRAGLGVVIVTHNAASAALADRIVVI